ncbi:methylated-DNA--protein-cysteine methyltransferase isoform X2 [Callithrix jacchus]
MRSFPAPAAGRACAASQATIESLRFWFPALPGNPSPKGRGEKCLQSSVLGKMDKTCEMKRTMLDSPLGKLELSGCEQGLHKISFLGQGTPAAERLRSVAGQPCPPARAKSPRCLVNMQFSQHLPRRSNSAMEVPAPAEVLRGPEPLKQCAAWLNAYFQQPEAIEELPVPALHHPVFQQESFTRQVLWELLKAVKFGEVVSYQQLAALAGNPKAARAVGGAMRSNPVPILIPCHRVVCSSGAMGNYSGGLAVKEWLLVHEGHRVGKPALGRSSRRAGAWLRAVGPTSGSPPAGPN